MKTGSLRGCVASLVAAMGCTAPVDPSAADSSTGDVTPTSTSGEPIPDPSVDPSVDSTIDPSTTTETGVPDTTESGEDSSTTTVDDTTTGGVLECSTFDQDCPEGFKCMPYDDAGGGTWNTTGCFPIVDEPVGLGEACEFINGGASGEDTCDEGLMCWGEPGECLALCGGTPAMAECPEQSACTISNGGAVAVCLPSCDPLLDECGEAQACYPVGPEAFGCAPAGGAGQGEACQFINSCAQGLMCAGGDIVAGCNAAGCCTAFCDTGDPTDDCADTGEGMACVPFFAEGMAPAGYESLGVCAAL